MNDQNTNQKSNPGLLVLGSCMLLVSLYPIGLSASMHDLNNALVGLMLGVFGVALMYPALLEHGQINITNLVAAVFGLGSPVFSWFMITTKPNPLAALGLSAVVSLIYVAFPQKKPNAALFLFAAIWTYASLMSYLFTRPL